MRIKGTCCRILNWGEKKERKCQHISPHIGKPLTNLLINKLLSENFPPQWKSEAHPLKSFPKAMQFALHSARVNKFRLSQAKKEEKNQQLTALQRKCPSRSSLNVKKGGLSLVTLELHSAAAGKSGIE